MLYHVLQFKGEPKKNKNKIVKYKFYILAHIRSGSDSYVKLNILPQWRTVVSLIKNGSSIVSFNFFDGNVDENKKIPQYIHFTCSRVHIYNSVKKNKR